MKTTKKQSIKLRTSIIIGTGIVLILLTIVCFYLLRQTPTNTSTVNSNPSDETNKTQPTTNQSSSPSTDSSPIKSAKNPDTSSTSSESLSVSITKYQNKDLLQIRALINKLSSSGNCTLTMSQGSSTVSPPSVNIQNQANSSTCMGFDIPISELKTGEWNINLVVLSEDQKASITDKVTIN